MTLLKKIAKAWSEFKFAKSSGVSEILLKGLLHLLAAIASHADFVTDATLARSSYSLRQCGLVVDRQLLVGEL
jgi:hypothetical protein